MSEMTDLLKDVPADVLAKAKQVHAETKDDIGQLANALTAMGGLAALAMDAKGIDHRAINSALTTAYADAFARSLVMAIEPSKLMEMFDSAIPALRAMTQRYSAEFEFQQSAKQATVAEQGNA